MATVTEIRSHRNALAKQAAKRFNERSRRREDLLGKIEEAGILGAAGTESAVRRAAHMTIAEGRVIAARRTPRSEDERTLEAVVGIDDSDHINFMGRGQVAARAVCRLVLDGQAVGTGFLVAPGVLLTNNHVIASADDAARFVAEFDYELDLDDQPRVPVVRFDLDPERLFVTSGAEDGLDFTFVAVRDKSLRSGGRISDFGWIPLDDRIDKILVGEPAVIIQHPRGEPKRVCIFSAELVDKLEDHLHYMTDTDGGSSGSAVFNRSWQLVALHHAAVRSDERRRARALVVNEGVRVSSILRALENAVGVEGDCDKALSAISASEVVGDGRPQRTDTRRSSERDDRAGRAPSRRDLEATKIRRKAPGHFDDRGGRDFGYDPRFLGLSVPLPAVPAALADDLATTSTGEPELKYTHYSVLLSSSRRLPVVTAVNINGARSVSLGRKDRDFEAADIWSWDPRISEDEQLGAAVYDRTDFDYGHMVRREDPVWGDDNTARMANDDTFYMTNCAPQHNSLNTKTWRRLEDAILHSARKLKRKVSVFTGPVLNPQDPTVLDVQVPTAFWKIVAYVEDGELAAHGFMQWQTQLVEDLVVRPEGFRDALRATEEYQVSIREIARATGLDFGPLLVADSLGGELEGRTRRSRRRRLDEALIRELFEGRAAQRPRTAHQERDPRRPIADEWSSETARVRVDHADSLHLARRTGPPPTREELVDALRSAHAVLSRLVEGSTNGRHVGALSEES